MVPDMRTRSELVMDNVDVKPILSQIEAKPHLWNQYGYRKDLDAHKEMADIWVRYNDIINLDMGNPTAFNEPHIPVWYPAWRELTALHEIIHMLMTITDGEMLGGVLITKIPPGGKILPHTDTGWHVDYFSKFYLSLKSPEGSVFAFQEEGAPDDTREEVRPKVGEVWFIDNRKRHWVDNPTDKERMTLIVCIRTEKYWRSL